MFKAIIEMPKGCTRRIHLKDDKSGFIDLGEIKEKISVNDGIMPIDYGYLVDVINKEEGDFLDVIIFSNNKFKTGDLVEVNPIGILKREDGDEKIIATDELVKINSWEEVPENERKLILEYFGYNSKIKEIGDVKKAEDYIKSCIRANGACVRFTTE